jgi:hypothetical protein
MLVLRVRDSEPDASLPGTAVGEGGASGSAARWRLEQLCGITGAYARPGEDGGRDGRRAPIPLRWTDAA